MCLCRFYVSTWRKTSRLNTAETRRTQYQTFNMKRTKHKRNNHFQLGMCQGPYTVHKNDDVSITYKCRVMSTPQP